MHERDQVWCVHGAQRDWAASISLNAMAIPSPRAPGPLVILLLLRTVAKVDSIGFVAYSWPFRHCDSEHRLSIFELGRRRFEGKP